MATSMPKEDQALIKAMDGNDKCADCEDSNPSWCSISFGILLCLECSGRHRGLGVHISFVRSLDMDGFSKKQIDLLKAGGNGRCNAFLMNHGNIVAKTIAKEKYDNPHAELYKLQLKARVEGIQEPTELPLLSQSVLSSNTATATPMTQHGARTTLTHTPNNLSRFASACQFVVWPMTPMIVDQLYHKHLIASCSGVIGMIGAASIVVLITKPANLLNKVAGGTICCFTLLAGCGIPMWMVHAFSTNRLAAFPLSVEDYNQRCRVGRAKRNLGYEVFFPPGVSIGDSVKHALVFYPGMLIDHMAYATILGKLSDCGILVLLVNAEPSRLSNEVATLDHLKRLRHEICTLMGITVEEWILGGHSLGGMAAARLLQQRTGPTDITRLVQWAIPGEPCHYLLRKSRLTSVLRISASQDGVVQPFEISNAHIRSKFPATCDVQLERIIGGNHAGFGHYGPQHFPTKDKEREGITLEEQQTKVVQWTARFINGGDKKKKQ